NSEVKPLSADGSVGSPHVRVGHRQASKAKRAIPYGVALFLCSKIYSISIYDFRFKRVAFHVALNCIKNRYRRKSFT
ncbi:MAG: hypothetical protein Q8K17_00670, partial [Pseudohongiella sp.]|nr:hypothetical protein [Pseudohongiella sp.]